MHGELLKTLGLAQAGGFSILQGPGPDGRGNIVLKFEDAAGCRVLKLYRRRWTALQEWGESLVARTFLRKTPASAWGRYRTESGSLKLWRREGFDVFRILDLPLPSGIQAPALWLEYCPGRTLTDLYRDPGAGWQEILQVLQRLGREQGRRHQRAMELDEPLLIQKHGTSDHAWICGERLITMDLEGSFLPGFPILEGLSQELSGYLRSIAKDSGERHEEAFQVYIDGYPSKTLLKEIAQWAVSGRSLYRRLTRRQDQKRRPTHGKTEVLARVLKSV
jgi:hypothetical protein